MSAEDFTNGSDYVEPSRKPGKPQQIGNTEVSTITVEWAEPSDKAFGAVYQLRFKDVTDKDRVGRWVNHMDLERNTVQISDLKPNSRFVCQVRMVTDDDDFPWSEMSDEMTTDMKNKQKLSMKPGKPRQTGKFEVDAITVEWMEPPNRTSKATYHMRFKNVTNIQTEARWVYRSDLKQNKVQIDDLPSNSKFVCQVKLVTDNDDFPWSETSEEMKTNKEPTQMLLRPGKPRQTETKADSIDVTWDEPHRRPAKATYQLRFRNFTDRNSVGCWVYRTDLGQNTVQINDLPPNSIFTCQVRMVTDDNDFPWSQMSKEMKTNMSNTQTGKPYQTGAKEVDTIYVNWSKPSDWNYTARYQLRFKKVMSGKSENIWVYLRDLKDNTTKLRDLESGAEFICQVRMVQVGCPWSKESEKMITVQSAAARLLPDMSRHMSGTSGTPEKKRLPFQEDKSARNETAKTRKLILGDKPNLSGKEKIIMLLGATGVGKSSLVDGLINYILGVAWRDSFRVTVKHLEPEEKKVENNQAKSQTTWITCYIINPLGGSRINYTLTIIDTPGYGSVEGVEADQAITEQIRMLFTDEGTKGIQWLDAVCFVVKAPDARLTPTQRYIFDSILSVFGNDMKENFCMLMTFSDGTRPEVLAALKEAKLPTEKYFTFNNSATFAANNEQTGTDLERTKIDWNMGKREFKRFFEELEILYPKSLTLSKEVLQERKRLETTLENMQKKIETALTMIDNLNKEIRFLKENREQIMNSDTYTYTAQEIQREIHESKRDNMNCARCQNTCHEKCLAFNFNFLKTRCEAMIEGFCTQCDGKCPSMEHIVEKRLYLCEAVTVEKTYDKTLSYEQNVENIEKKLLTISNEINEMVEHIVTTKNRLNQIAIRQDPLSFPDVIDYFIAEEKIQRREGWNERLEVLQRIRKQAIQTQDPENVAKDVRNTIGQATLTWKNNSVTPVFESLIKKKRI